MAVFLSPSLGKLYNNSASMPLYQLGTLLRIGRNHVLFGGRIVFEVENVRLATDLTVFDVSLAFALGVVDDDFVPFPAACALEACVHEDIVS
jgi:hypothetical protein